MISALIELSFLFFSLFIFHLLEYVISGIYHPETTNSGSTLITIPFVFAFSFGVAEFFIEYHLFGDMKIDVHNPAMWIGLVFTVLGLFIRFLAECTAKQSFTHSLAYERKENHKLITFGVYKVIRHPGYFGMFVFAIGTQIYLRNPISTVVFASVLWKFFSDRILEEETALVAMYGQDYVEYRGKTKTWIPFIP